MEVVFTPIDRMVAPTRAVSGIQQRRPNSDSPSVYYHKPSRQVCHELALAKESFHQSHYLSVGGILGSIDDDQAKIARRRVDANVGEIEIGGHESHPMRLRMCCDLRIGSTAEANAANVHRLMAESREQFGHGARKTGID